MRNRPDTGTWLLAPRTAAALAVLGVALTFALFAQDLRTKEALARAARAAEADERTAALETEQAVRGERLRAFAAFVAADGGDDEARFARFTAETRASHPLDIAWAFLVPAAERAGYEARARPARAGGRIWERGPDGAPRPAGERADYWPVRLAESETRLWERGLDLGADPVLRAVLEKAAQTGEPARSDFFRSPTERDRAFYVRAIPVLSPSSAGPARVRGAVVGLFRTGEIVELVLSRFPAGGQHVVQFSSDRDDATPIWVHAAPGADATAPGRATTFGEVRRRPGVSIRAVRTADRRLPMAFIPARPHELAESMTPGSWAILPLGLGLTGAVVLAQRRAWALARAFEESAARTRRVLDTWPDALVVVDADGRVVHANARVGGLLGYEPDELLGRPVEQLVPVEQRSGHAALRAARPSDPEEAPPRRGPTELSARHKDGRSVAVEISRSAIEFDARPCTLATVRDLTALRAAEASRREMERRYQTLFHDAGVAFFLSTGFADPLIEGNDAAAQLLGAKSRDELRGLSPLAISDPVQADGEPAAVAADRIAGTLAAGASAQFDWRVRRLDGARIDCRFALTPIRLDGRDVALNVVRDVTQERWAFEALRQAQARSSLLFSSSPLPSWVYDLETLRLVEVNDAACEKYGWSREEFLAMTLLDIRPPEDRAAVVADVLRQAGRFQVSGWRHRLRDGTTIDVQVSSQRIDYAGRPAAMVVVHDITEQLRAEAGLRESEARFRAVMEAAPDPIYLNDESGRIVEVNERGCAVLGYSREEVLRLRVSDIDLFADPSRVEELRQALSSRALRVFPGLHRRKDGTTFPVEVALSSLTFAGRQAMLAIARDVTEREEAQRAVRESQQLLQRAQELARLAAWTIELDGGAPVFRRDRADGLVDGLPAVASFDEVLARFHPDDVAGLREGLRIAMAGNAFETEARFRSGEQWRWLRVVTNAERHPDGRVKRLIGLSQDVTARKEQEIELREAEERYREIVENSSELIHRVDAATGRFQFVNAAWTTAMGYSREEALALRLRDVVAPEWADTVGETLVRLAGGETIRDVEVELVAKDGRRVPLEGNVVPRVSDGATVSMQAVFRDVTDRRRRDRLRGVRYEVARILTETSTLDDALPRVLAALGGPLGWDYAHVYVRDEAGALRPTAWWHDGSEAMQRLVATSREIGGETVDAAMLSRVVDRGVDWIDDLTAAGAGGPAASRRARAALQAGLTTIVAAPLVTEAQLVGGLVLGTRRRRAREADVAALLDELRAELGQFLARVAAQSALEAERNRLAARVTERTEDLQRLNAELARANRLKDEFLAAMSHELRTPLNSILGLSEALLERVYGELAAPQAQALHTVQESGKHLLAVINDILDLSKIEAGRIVLVREPVAVEPVCISATRMVKEAAKRKGLTLSMSVEPPELEVPGDARRLKQVLVNLLSNAVKFTPGGGSVGLAASRGGDLVRLVVSDTGIGIAPEDLPRLFQPFVQLDSRLAREHEGTGLGLALVRRLVDLHGGRVSVDSTPGEGTRVTVELPLDGGTAAVPAAAPAAVEEPARAPAPESAEMPLVVVGEDNEAMARLVVDYLEPEGFRVKVAGDGEKAIALVREERPALALMDVQMPKVDGLEAIRRIRRTPGFETLPIVAVTALAMSGDRERCLEAGATDYLAKPVRLAELLAMVRRLLG
ncbi:MAG: PAS domain S-box protein [Vicinamibacteria bacterium]